MNIRLRFRRLAAHIFTGIVAAATLTASAWADDRSPPTPLLPRYQQECAGCHLAFPPGLLPVGSWQRVMNSLPRHFGTDASLDAETVRELSAWLAANAATGRQLRREPAAPPQDRITQTGWFVHEHREIAPATWQRPAVGRASNCAACHTGAAQGRFSEHDVRIPR